MSYDELVDLRKRLIKDRDEHEKFFPSDKSYYGQQSMAIRAVDELLGLKKGL